uniref:Small ribosomal subunit protein mS29 n=1 Tax=Timema douglasi TaxID=61478 RepID=A0A7R8VV05_TIMDO|nr:unnamed protein product [Timema douglasi]
MLNIRNDNTKRIASQTPHQRRMARSVCIHGYQHHEKTIGLVHDYSDRSTLGHVIANAAINANATPHKSTNGNPPILQRCLSTSVKEHIEPSSHSPAIENSALGDFRTCENNPICAVYPFIIIIMHSLLAGFVSNMSFSVSLSALPPPHFLCPLTSSLPPSLSVPPPPHFLRLSLSPHLLTSSISLCPLTSSLPPSLSVPPPPHFLHLSLSSHLLTSSISLCSSHLLTSSISLSPHLLTSSYPLYGGSLKVGRPGCGKSLTLAHVVHFGLTAGFLLVHVPWVANWTRRPREVSSSTTREGFVDLPLDAATWLVHFKSQNSALLNKLDSNGAVVVTVDQIAASDDRQASVLPLYQLGKEGFEHLDPFVPIRVSEYNAKEIESCLQYYIDRRWIQNPDLHTEEGRKELAFLSGNNPYHLMNMCTPL